MRSATENDAVVAACVTPPAAGGVAIVQVVGADLAGVLGPVVRSRRPLSFEQFDPAELRLCRIVDGEQVIDDVLLAVRRSPEQFLVADLNLHGGPRIVQRVLLLLQRHGARIVEPGDLPVTPWQSASGVEREVLALLPRAATRAVARWLVAGVPRLESALRQVLDALDAGRLDDARRTLQEMIPPPAYARYLLDGVRVAVIGEPNVGKSTLVNALAGRDHAIVSDVPGTTRDWVEHAGAIDGLPFTFIDTAGMRPTNDPIEAEAIRRAEEQTAEADLVLRVFDRSAPLPVSDPPDATRPVRPQIEVFNKCDLPAHPSHRPSGTTASAAEPRELNVRADSNTVMVSAVAGSGLEALRNRLLEAAGLAGWQDRFFLMADRHREAAAGALSALEREDAALARTLLQDLLTPDGSPSRGL